MIYAQAAPMVVMLSTLFYFENIALAFFNLNLIAYILIPYIYIRFLSKEKEIKPYFMNEFRDRHKQVKTGLSLAASAFGLLMFSYIFLYEFRHNMLRMIHVPIPRQGIELLFLFLTMQVINPILEEWFWRIFLPKTQSQHTLKPWIINSNYTLFHFVILWFCLKWKYAIGLATTFFQIGRSFDYIRDKYGIVTGILTHIGLSFASFFVICDLLLIEGN